MNTNLYIRTCIYIYQILMNIVCFYFLGIPVESFVHMTKRMCGIPSFFNLPLCKRINEIYNDDITSTIKDKDTNNSNSNSNIRQSYGINIKLKTFLKFWENEIEPYDRLERFFRAIKQPDSECIYKDDFVPFIQVKLCL